MNIIKFTDSFIDGDDNYNNNYRAKYCYIIRWEKIVPVDILSKNGYIDACRTGDCITDYILYDDYKEYIDVNVTEKINSVDEYIYYNSNINNEFTIDQLKRFRTFVAESLISASSLWEESYNKDLVDPIHNMLSYYVNGMWDCAIKQMLQMQQFKPVLKVSSNACCYSSNNTDNINNVSVIFKSKGCECNNNSVIDLTTDSSCMSSYRSNIYNLMVMVFSDIEWWKKFNTTIVKDIYTMIDLIIKYDFNLNTNESTPILGDCGCNSNNDVYKSILTNVSSAFKLIESNEITNNKNFISLSLYNWASNLYEKMEW